MRVGETGSLMASIVPRRRVGRALVPLVMGAAPEADRLVQGLGRGLGVGVHLHGPGATLKEPPQAQRQQGPREARRWCSGCVPTGSNSPTRPTGSHHASA